MPKQTVTTRVKSTKLTDQHPWVEILFRFLEIWTSDALKTINNVDVSWFLIGIDIYIICMLYIYISTWANIRPDLIWACPKTVGISTKLLYYYIENDDWPWFTVFISEFWCTRFSDTSIGHGPVNIGNAQNRWLTVIHTWASQVFQQRMPRLWPHTPSFWDFLRP